MRFGKLRIRGFMAFGPEEQTFRLYGLGRTLIEGENRDDPTVDNNGAGKSSFLEALLWCLFGKTLRGYVGDRVVNRKLRLSSGCCVSVDWVNDRGDRFSVVRYRLDPKEKNALRFSGGTRSQTGDTQEGINEALGMDFDTFVNAVVFGQGTLKSFSTMTDKEQKKLTDKFIGIESLSEAGKLVNKDVNNIDKEIDALESKRKDPEQLQEQVDLLSKQSQRWKEDIRKKIDKLRDEIDALPATGQDVTDLEAELRVAKESVKFAATEVGDASKSHTNAHAETKVAKSKLEDHQKRRDKLMAKGGTCEKCGSEVTTEDLEEHRATHDTDIKFLRTEVDNAKGEEDRKWDTLQKKQKKLDEAEAVVTRTKSRLDELERQRTERQKKRERKKEVEAEENPHTKALRHAEKMLESAAAENEESDKAIKKLKRRKKKLEFVATMFSDKGSPKLPPLKSLVIEAVTPFINKKLAYYCKKLTAGNITVELDTQSTTAKGEERDQYSLKVVNQFGAEDYEGASGGEKRKVNVAIFFAFQSLVANRAKERVNFAVWDEVFDALDETAQEGLMEVLQSEKKDTMFVITQRPELRSYFARTIKIVKHKGFSRAVK